MRRKKRVIRLSVSAVEGHIGKVVLDMDITKKNLKSARVQKSLLTLIGWAAKEGKALKSVLD